MRKPGGRFSGTESVFSGLVLDPAKCSQLSLEEKRELVHEIAQYSCDAPEVLRSWSRRELLEIICAEMGKERKYTGFTKSRMIERLLKLVSENSKKNNTNDTLAFSLAKSQNTSKRPRLNEHPPRLDTDMDQTDQINGLLCQNLFCRATLSPEDEFCKRCSCCICYHYDDYKDPSLWLSCSSSSPNQDDSCGMSCHLKCALKHERAGIMKNGCFTKLDGGFYCVLCGKINGLMRTWRKQLLLAKETRRVDALCLRISLGHKILKGTERYKELQRIVDTAAKKLKKEVGPLDRVSAKMARGIVNRLACGPEVQKLCSYAVETLDCMLSDPYSGHMDLKGSPTCLVQFEEVSPTSVIVVLEYEDGLFEDLLGCRLWHRRSAVMEYPGKPTWIVLRPEKRFLISDLDPSTEYFFRASMFSSTRILGVWEAKCVTQPPARGSASAIDEEEHGKEELAYLIVEANSQRDSTNSSEVKVACNNHHSKVRSLEEISKTALTPLVDSGGYVPPATPCKSNNSTQVVTGSGFQKQSTNNKDYEYCVRVIRWLERKGHINKDVRVKLLTWFSLRATTQERRVVSAFVDTLIDDPSSLAGQLVDTFMDEICNEQKQKPGRVQNGFCTRLWH